MSSSFSPTSPPPPPLLGCSYRGTNCHDKKGFGPLNFSPGKIFMGAQFSKNFTFARQKKVCTQFGTLRNPCRREPYDYQVPITDQSSIELFDANLVFLSSYQKLQSVSVCFFFFLERGRQLSVQMYFIANSIIASWTDR